MILDHEKIEPLWLGKKRSVPFHYSVKALPCFLALLNMGNICDDDEVLSPQRR